MKALLLDAEWKPKEGYQLGEEEKRTKSTYNGSMVFYHPTPRMVDIPVPSPEPGEVLVKVKATGVCGSDVHLCQELDDGYTAYPGHCSLPVVLGHEWSGRVVELGEGVTTIQEGDLVAVEEMQWCGECTACRSGLFDQCTNLEEIGFTEQGAFAEYVAVPEKHCWKINAIAEAYNDEDKAFELGAMVEPCCVAYNGIFISAQGFLPGSNVLVAGCGPVGLMAIALVRAAGAARVIAMEPSPSRRKMALTMGADYAFDPLNRDEDVSSADVILEQTRDDGVMLAVEAAAAGPQTYPTFEAVLAPNGKIVQAGMSAERVPVSMLRVQWQRLHIHGSVGHSGGIFPNATRLMAAKQIDLSPLVTARFELEEAVQAIERAETLQDAKVMVLQ